eukprot:743390-Prymnesium_polylepis.1
MHIMHSMFLPPHSPNSDASRMLRRGYSPISPPSDCEFTHHCNGCNHKSRTCTEIALGAQESSVHPTHPTRTLPGCYAEAIV